MPISAGFQTDNLGAISMYQRQSTVTRQVNGVAVDSVGNVFYANAATVGVSLIRRAGLLWTVDGAICVTTTDPGNTRQVNGFKVSAAGEMFVTTTAPAPTSQITFDPILGYLRVSNSGAVHVAPYPVLDANLAAFYLPGVGQTNASGACSAWADQSGNGRNLAQGTAGKRPTINADGSLTFDGTDDAMAVAFTLNQPTVVTILVTPISWTLTDALFDGGAVANFTGELIQYNTASPNLQAYAGAFSGDFTGPAVGTKAVLQVVFNGASSSIQMNNGTALTGNFGASNMGGITVGSVFDQINQNANIRVQGLSVRNASNATVNANDRNFWMRVGNL